MLWTLVRETDMGANYGRKLQLVHDHMCNKYTGGVDRNDELLGTYCCVRKSMNWTKKVALHFVEESLLNVHILYKTSGRRKPPLKCKLDCISALLAASSTDPMAPDASDRFRAAFS